MTRILGPLPCIRCGGKVFWDRVGDQLRLMERGHGKGARPAGHICPGRKS